ATATPAASATAASATLTRQTVRPKLAGDERTLATAGVVLTVAVGLTDACGEFAVVIDQAGIALRRRALQRLFVAVTVFRTLTTIETLTIATFAIAAATPASPTSAALAVA